jgi:hypothetical protein
MRHKTKSELAQLADLMVDKFDLDKIIGSNEFLEQAIFLANQNYIALNRQTLVRYESDLKEMCKVRCFDKIELRPEIPFNDEHFDEFLEQYEPEPKRKLVMTINYYDDGTYEKVKPEQKREVHKLRIPEYTMFAEGEDGLIVLKGTYKGKTLDEINIVAGFDTAKKGWARYMLQQDKNLTDDDRDIFNKIMLGGL